MEFPLCSEFRDLAEEFNRLFMRTLRTQRDDWRLVVPHDFAVGGLWDSSAKEIPSIAREAMFVKLSTGGGRNDGVTKHL